MRVKSPMRGRRGRSVGGQALTMPRECSTTVDMTAGVFGVFEVVEVGEVEGPDADDGCDTSAVGRMLC